MLLIFFLNWYGLCIMFFIAEGPGYILDVTTGKIEKLLFDPCKCLFFSLRISEIKEFNEHTFVLFGLSCTHLCLTTTKVNCIYVAAYHFLLKCL
jgi:hypothetical protein